MAKRIAVTVNKKEDIDYLLNLTEEEGLKLSFIMDNFCPFEDNTPRFHVYDIFHVPADSYGPVGMRNKQAFVTTVGKWVFNKVFIEKELFEIFHYINDPITQKVFDKINKELSHAVIEDRIPLDSMKHYLMKTQKYQPYCSVLCPSISVDCMEIPKKIKPIKDALLKKYKKELDAKDPIIAQKIEKELLAECEKILEDDEFMDLIRSGTRISWGNNFKNMFVIRGAIKESDPTRGGYAVIRSNYSEGMDKEDYADFANSLTGGPYSRARKTEIGGAWEKMFVRAFQHLTVLPDGTDCGTKRTLEITLDKSNIDSWMYSYIVEGNKLVELTSQNVDKYIGKKVKLRFSALCESDKGICSVCAGHLFNRIGLTEVGIASYQICSVIKNKAMKAFHDSTVKITNIERDYGLNKVFGLQ